MRYAARVDGNQGDIIKALEQAGATVEILKEPLDLLVGYRHKWLLMECKASLYQVNVETPTRKRQKAFAERHPNGGPIATVWDVQGALRAIGAMT